MMGEVYIQTADAAKILGVSQRWVAALCRAGSLEAARGTGRGSPWIIKKSSVDDLAEERAGAIDAEALEAVADAIATDEEARELATAKAEESFMDRVLKLAKDYSFGASLVVAGVAHQCYSPGNVIGIELIVAGIREVVRAHKARSR